MEEGCKGTDRAGILLSRGTDASPVSVSVLSDAGPFPEPGEPVRLSVDQHLGEETERNRGSDVDDRVLFDESGGNADDHNSYGDKAFPSSGSGPVFKPC